MDYKIKVINKEDFPDKLKNIKKSPKKLYTIGNIELLYQDSFGIVGTRNPTEYGKKVCKEFSKEFALRDIPIVSGMAVGIDEIAHKTVLEHGAKTIAVLGEGFGNFLNSVEENEIFFEIIKHCGLIVSEYDVDVEKNKKNFPKRNRIVAALSEGILAVEAAYRSGSSITAKWAREYEKKVFAVPGRIYDSMSIGTNNLIKKGAILSTSIEEILTNYPQFANKKRKTLKKSQKEYQTKCVRKDFEEIVKLLEIEMLSIEDLQVKTKKDIREIMKLLLEMEMEGILEQEIGIGYKLKRR